MINIKVGKTIETLNVFIVSILLITLPLAFNDPFIIRPIENRPFFSLYYEAIPILILSLITNVLLKKSITINKIDVFVIIFVCYRFFHSCILNDSFHFRSVYELILFTLLYFALSSFNYRALSVLLYAILASALFQSTLGQAQLYGFSPSRHSLYNITGTFFNPAPLAGYLCCSFPVALLLYLKRRKINRYFYRQKIVGKAEHILSLLCLVTIIIVLPATRSRSAWLSVIVVSLLIISHHAKQEKAYLAHIQSIIKNKTFLMASILLCMLFLLGIYYLKKDSADGRLLIWQASAQMWQKKPLFGWGDNGFKAAYMLAQANFFKQNTEHDGVNLSDNVQYTYNESIRVLVEYGIIGFVIVFMIAYYVFKLNTKNQLLRIAQNGLLGLFIFSLFSYPLDVIVIKMNGVLFLALASSFSSPVFQINKKKSVWMYLTLLLLIIPILPHSNRKVKNYYQALGAWNDASDIYGAEAYEECLDDFQSAYPHLKWNGEFLIQYGKALSMAKRDEEAIRILESAKPLLNNTILYTALGDSYARIGMFNEAETAYWKAYYMVPNRFYPLYLLAKLYEKAGEYDKALTVVALIEEKPVKVKSRAIEEIKNEMQELKKRLAL